jgi:ferric-dicitrate binding protein FerR (iron transport regulator)
MLDEQLLVIITKDINQEASPEEKMVLEDWLHQSGEHVALYHSFREAYVKGVYPMKVIRQDQAFEMLAGRLRFEDSVHDKHRVDSWEKTKHFPEWKWAKIAAAILLFAFSLFAANYIIHEGQMLDKSAAVDKLIVKSNPKGQKSTIVLPDGSLVKLNSESHLEYHTNFDEKRSVKLVGEAFFEVVRDTLRPFVVHTGDISVVVLGTSFNVQAFPFEREMTVAVASGRVQLQRKEQMENIPIDTLQADQKISFNHNTNEYRKSNFNTQEVLGWKDGVLVFREAPFTEVVDRLERWYGVVIEMERNRTIGGGYNGIYDNDPLEEVLEGIGFSSGFDFQIKGDKVIIR